jgi:ubiquinone/menaquinone biosynthesis C-methylase UbiE
MDFSSFDSRKYPTVSARDGYGEWVATYEQTVVGEMDLRLFARIHAIPWTEPRRTIDLACGTGRTGVWLHQHGVQEIDGIDMTPGMLEVARAKRVHRQLILGDVTQTPLKSETYDLAVQSLADEHLADIRPLYREVARIVKPNGYFVIVGYHPHFLMLGIQTHFHRATGEPIAIKSYVHLLSEHFNAGTASGWTLLEMDEGIIDDDWIAEKPKWAKYLRHPVSFSMVWQKR